jgi:hypothetical protein
MKTSIKTILFVPAAFAILASSLSAQTSSSKSLSWDTIWGPSNRRAYIQPVMRGSISKENMRTSTSRANKMRYEAHGQFRARVKFLYSIQNAVSITADASLVEGVGRNKAGYVAGAPTYDSSRATLVLRLGSSVIDYQRSGSGQLASYSRQYTAFSSTQTFYVAYIPITLRGSVGARIGGSFGTVLTLSPSRSSRMTGNSSIGLTGSGTGYIEADADVMLGWSGFGAGFNAEFRFLETTISVGVSGSNTGIQGSIGIAVQPARLSLSVFAEAYWRVSKRIYSWRFGAVRRITKTYR